MSEPNRVIDFLTLAEREALIQHGARIIAFVKGKSLIKFGRTANADDGVETTVAEFQGAVVNETYATTNSIDFVVSSSASDTGDICIEGHTVDANGDLTFVTQNLTLTGQTAVALTTALVRANRADNTTVGTIASPAVDFVENIAIYDAVVAPGTTAGVPDVATATKLLIPAGLNHSDKCATSISSSDFWIVTGFSSGIEKVSGAAAQADIDVFTRRIGQTWRPAFGAASLIEHDVSPNDHVELRPYSLIPPNSDVRMLCTSDSANTVVHGVIYGLLAKVID